MIFIEIKLKYNFENIQTIDHQLKLSTQDIWLKFCCACHREKIARKCIHDLMHTDINNKGRNIYKKIQRKTRLHSSRIPFQSALHNSFITQHHKVKIKVLAN